MGPGMGCLGCIPPPRLGRTTTVLCRNPLWTIVEFPTVRVDESDIRSLLSAYGVQSVHPKFGQHYAQ